MSFISNLWRLAITGTTFARTGALDQVLTKLEAPRALRVVAKGVMFPIAWLGYKGDPKLPPVVRAITALGPSYVKLGQILSTRPDVTGDELSRELRILQDRLPPFSTEVVKREIQREFGGSVDELFSEFSEPIAAASIAQVHRARLLETGQEVAVKVRRPDIARAFRRDIDAFYFVSDVLEFFIPKSRRLKPREVTAHFDHVVQGELDFRLEASAASEFKDNSANDHGFDVPAVYWPLCSERVLTTTWVDGTNFGDVDALRAAGVDLVNMAERVMQTFLRQALRDGFFHGDMHQGNLKVAPDGTLIALDFGIMGRIDVYTRRVYAEILFGFLSKNFRRVAEVHFEAGYVPADQDMDAFAQALRAVAEPIFGQDARNISMGKLLAHLFDVTERFGMSTRTELLLLQRTMVVVEGVSRSLDPAMNMWTVAKPVVEDYIKASIGPKAIAKDLAETLRILARFGPLLPHMAEDLLIRTNADKPKPEHKTPTPGWVWFTGGVVASILCAQFAYLIWPS